MRRSMTRALSISKRSVAAKTAFLFSKTGYLFAKMGRFLAKKKTIVENITLFIYTGTNKLMDFDTFRNQVTRSPFLENLIYIALAIPAGEILLSLLLIIKRTRLLGLYLSFLLMAIFTGYIWLMLNYAPDLPCSCGGIMKELSWQDHLIFNSAFTGLGIVGIILQSKIIQENNNIGKLQT
jgi:hypothetical protein